MSTKNIVFYRDNKEVLVDFSAEKISTDGAILLLEKIERKHKLIKKVSAILPDNRCSYLIEHDYEKLLKQRVFLMVQGYEDANDVTHLKHDPLIHNVLKGALASQPTISRFENTVDRKTIWEMSSLWVERYVKSLKGRKSIIIDVDGTDDPTHGNQQLSLFNGYYKQFMYNQLFFHDGETGQIILPVLRPGNSHSNKWFVSILKRILAKIKDVYPDIQITIRADGGFSGAAFYELADKENLLYAIGLPSNERLKKQVKRTERAVEKFYVKHGEKYQHFIEYEYKAKSWHAPQQCYAKVESTGIGLNTRHFVSNIPAQTAKEIYFDFYVKRGDASENRIKEVKNMCFSDRLSNHGFWANSFRLFMSSMVYEFFLLIKKMIADTSFEKAKKWQINSIRTYLLKVGATIKETKRRVFYRFSKSFVYQDLFKELILSP